MTVDRMTVEQYERWLTDPEAQAFRNLLKRLPPSDAELLKIIRQGYVIARSACFEAPYEHSAKDFENILITSILNALKTAGAL